MFLNAWTELNPFCCLWFFFLQSVIYFGYIVMVFQTHLTAGEHGPNKMCTSQFGPKLKTESINSFCLFLFFFFSTSVRFHSLFECKSSPWKSWSKKFVNSIGVTHALTLNVARQRKRGRKRERVGEREKNVKREIARDWVRARVSSREGVRQREWEWVRESVRVQGRVWELERERVRVRSRKKERERESES